MAPSAGAARLAAGGRRPAQSGNTSPESLNDVPWGSPASVPAVWVTSMMRTILVAAASAAVIASLVVLADDAAANHSSRGGTLQWERVSGGTVEFTGSMAWRSSVWGSPGVGTTLGFTWDLNVDGAGSAIVKFNQRVTYVHPTDNWFVAEFIAPAGGTPGVSYTYASPLGIYMPYIQPPAMWGQRVDPADPSATNDHINNPGSLMTLSAVVDLGAADASPAYSPPTPSGYTHPCVINAVCWIKIPVTHPTGAAMSYRLATDTEANGIPPTTPGTYLQVGEAGSGAPNAATVHPNGTIEWDTTGATVSATLPRTIYSMQVMTESGSVRAPFESMILLIPAPPPPPPKPPVADFDCTAMTSPYLRMAFTDLSTTPQGTITSRFWDLGDASSASSASFTHDYDEKKGYMVSLTVTNNDGLSDTVKKMCIPYANRPPVLDPVPDRTVYELTELRFSVAGHDPDGDPTVYSWSPGPLPSGATFDLDAQTFTWTPRRGMAGTYEGVAFAIHEVLPPGHPPPGSDTQAMTIEVLPVEDPPAPDQSDADGDGSPDQHDPCPSEAECGGDGSDGSADGNGQSSGPDGCRGQVPRPVDVEAVVVDATVVVRWGLDDPCALADRFLVWVGGGGLAGRVDGDARSLVVEAPPTGPHEYHIIAFQAGEPDLYHAARAVPSSPVDVCRGCDPDGDPDADGGPGGDLGAGDDEQGDQDDAGQQGAGGPDDGASVGRPVPFVPLLPLLGALLVLAARRR